MFKFLSLTLCLGLVLGACSGNFDRPNGYKKQLSIISHNEGDEFFYYDTEGRMVTHVYITPDMAIYTEYTYNEDGRLTREDIYFDGQTESQIYYEYDEKGELIRADRFQRIGGGLTRIGIFEVAQKEKGVIRSFEIKDYGDVEVKGRIDLEYDGADLVGYKRYNLNFDSGELELSHAYRTEFGGGKNPYRFTPFAGPLGMDYHSKSCFTSRTLTVDDKLVSTTQMSYTFQNGFPTEATMTQTDEKSGESLTQKLKYTYR